MDSSPVVKLLAVASAVSCSLLREKLAPLNLGLLCAATVSQVGELRRRGEHFEVILLPELLSELEWWPLWGELCLFSPRPSILVYTRRPTFQLWTAVLELGGYDVVSEPFGEVEIRNAVIQAAEDYRERASTERA